MENRIGTALKEDKGGVAIKGVYARDVWPEEEIERQRSVVTEALEMVRNAEVEYPVSSEQTTGLNAIHSIMRFCIKEQARKKVAEMEGVDYTFCSYGLHKLAKDFGI